MDTDSEVINLIRFVNVSKEYKNGVIALYDINIEINKVWISNTNSIGKKIHFHSVPIPVYCIVEIKKSLHLIC